MTTDKSNRQKEILQLFKNVDSSDLSVKKYFTTYETPISLSQYYRLKKRFDQQGIIGLEDNRTAVHSRKQSPQQTQLIRAVISYNQHETNKSLQKELQDKWEIELNTGQINQLRRKFNLPRIKLKTGTIQSAEFAGIEIFSALVHHIGILEHWNQTIKKRLTLIEQSEIYQNRNSQIGGHARHRNGRFSSRYNKLKKFEK